MITVCTSEYGCVWTVASTRSEARGFVAPNSSYATRRYAVTKLGRFMSIVWRGGDGRSFGIGEPAAILEPISPADD